MSLGGAIVQNISVLDDDVNSVVIASGMHSTYLTSGTAITPNILEYYDDPDLISTIAPKPLYLSWGIHEKSMYGHEANTLYSASKIEDAYRIARSLTNNGNEDLIEAAIPDEKIRK